MLVFGTRPEAIKMCPLVKEFQKYPKDFETVVCVTGQHREMLDQVLHIFDVMPDYDLNIMQQGQDLYDITARVLIGLRDVLRETKPDVVLVHGDTTTSMAAAMAAFYQQIPVGHVEAGLRTNNLYSPWPEEMNRQVTGRIAGYDFAPTPLSRKNLLAENVEEKKITVTGNTVIDALYMVVDKIKNDANLEKQLRENIQRAGYDIARLASSQGDSGSEAGMRGQAHNESLRASDNGFFIAGVDPRSHGSKRLVLITGHRRENFGDGFINMLTAIKDLAMKYPDVDFVYPMHLNPNVRRYIAEVNNHSTITDNLYFIEPLEYLQFVYLMEKCDIMLTDSGGIQEEAPSLGKPVLVMRDTTERPEALESGTVHLVGTNHDLIVKEVSTLLDDRKAYEKMSKAVNPYGDGKACSRIVETLRD